MSSIYVRDEITNFLDTEIPGENLIDLTGEFDDMEDFLSSSGLTYEDKWLGIQFIGANEIPVAVTANNTQGKYRENGSLFLHVVEPARNAAVNDILSRGEQLRNLLRGQRINGIIVESVTPLNFESSATLEFENGFTSASIIVNYYYDRII